MDVQIQQTNGQINTNFEEVKAYLTEQLEEYRTAVFTDESIKTAKVIVADLRKQQKEVNGRISEVRKYYMRPFEEFKEKADELLRLYDEPINFINDQVKDYTERQKQQKRILIESIYKAIFVDSLGAFSLESIYDVRWENATYKAKEVEKDICEIAQKITADLDTIAAFKSDATEEAVRRYHRDRDLQTAIAYIQNYEAQRTQIMEKENERRIEEAKRQEREKVEAEIKAEEEKKKAVEDGIQDFINAYTPEDTGAPTQDFIYNITLTALQKESLETWMDSIGLDWEVLNG